MVNPPGILLGLNGMAVGGKRRITVASNLVYYSGGSKDSLAKREDPRSICLLVLSSEQGKDNTKVRKVPLIVEATLTAACRPTFMHLDHFPLITLCLDTDRPRGEPDDPIWRFYVAEETPG